MVTIEWVIISPTPCILESHYHQFTIGKFKIYGILFLELSNIDREALFIDSFANEAYNIINRQTGK